MNRHFLAAFAGLILIVTLLAAWVLWRGRTAELPEEPLAPQAPGELGTFSIYTNGEYGFSVMYPESAVLDEEFDTKYFLPANWRYNALPTGEGEPVLALVTYAIESQDSYPRHFVTQVRIGASTDPAELVRCEQRATEQGEGELPDVTLNGTTYKAFSFQDAGMMQYVRGISYRTVHEGACVAIEKIQTGSSYRDDAASVKDISDETLQAEYEKLTGIIESFSFARP